MLRNCKSIYTIKCEVLLNWSKKSSDKSLPVSSTAVSLVSWRNLVAQTSMPKICTKYYMHGICKTWKPWEKGEILPNRSENHVINFDRIVICLVFYNTCNYKKTSLVYFLWFMQEGMPRLSMTLLSDHFPKCLLCCMLYDICGK